ncbi:hypothetical protein CSKR_113440, partial [Clonorchis sinensis]
PHSKRSLNITEVERHKIDTGVPVYTTGETGRVNIGWYPSFVQASDGSDLSWSGKKSPENSAFTLRGIAKLRHCVVLPVSTHYCIRTKPFALQTQINLFWRKYSSARTQHHATIYFLRDNAYGVSFDQELLHVLHQGFWTMSDAFFNHLVTERQKDASEMLYCASLVPKCNNYLHMLPTHVIPQPKHKKSSTVFQQDGAPPPTQTK